MKDERECCGNCRFRRGADCRKNPPVVFENPRGAITHGYVSIYPTVVPIDWCGSWEPKD